MDLEGTVLVLKDWHSLGMVARVCNLSTWEAEPEELWIQSQPGVHSKYEASLGDVARLCEKTPKDWVVSLWSTTYLSGVNPQHRNEQRTATLTEKL